MNKRCEFCPKGVNSAWKGEQVFCENHVRMTPPLSAAPTMTASGPPCSCLCWQSRRHCPCYPRHTTASSTMGPRPSSYATASMSVDTCTGGLNFCPLPRQWPWPAQRRQPCDCHYSCSSWQSQQPCCCCCHGSHLCCCRSVALLTNTKTTMLWLSSFLLALAITASLLSSSLWLLSLSL